MSSRTWDVASARVFAAVPGCRAIATTAGVAEVLGYTDQRAGTPRDEMVATVARIAAAVDLPVTATSRRHDDPAGTAAGAVEAGAVGLNFEDATYRDDEPLVDTATQADRISAIRDAGEAAASHS